MLQSRTFAPVCVRGLQIYSGLALMLRLWPATTDQALLQGLQMWLHRHCSTIAQALHLQAQIQGQPNYTSLAMLDPLQVLKQDLAR